MNNRQAVKAANQRRRTWQPDDPGTGVLFPDHMHMIVRFANKPGGDWARLLRECQVIIDNQTITIPAGFETDFASIPRRLRGIVSIDRGVGAAVVHDWLYRQGVGTRKEADLVYKRLLEATEGWATVQAMYWSVRLGGASSWQGSTKEPDNA